MKKYDERNTLFSRVNLKENTNEYDEFYKDKILLKIEDDKIRNKPFRDNLRKSDRFKSLFFPLTSSNKKHIKVLFDMVESEPVSTNRLNVPDSFRDNIKEITKYYGATDVGIVKLSDYHYYSHLGGVSDAIGLDTYNQEVIPRYNTAIVFTIKMDKEMINRAPHFEELLATEEAYLKVAHVGARLAMYLKSIGYKAIFNHSEYYEVPLVPLAYDAGLGQIGMCNHIVTKEYGNNVRLGAVLTTLELPSDKPIDFGLESFCSKCALCLMNCPSKSIKHQKRVVNGRPFYKFVDYTCYNLWVRSGTDCGTCIQACPFTQGVDQNKLHNIKDNPEVIDEILEEHKRKHGRRAYLKDELDIVKMKDD